MSIISRIFNSKIFRITCKCLVVAGIALIATHPGFARDKYETLEAQAWGTGTQMGASIGIKAWPEAVGDERDRLIEAKAQRLRPDQDALTVREQIRRGGIEATPGACHHAQILRCVMQDIDKRIDTRRGQALRFVGQYRGGGIGMRGGGVGDLIRAA